jgi:nucleotide-binding universal stress UspA family protein
MGASEAPGPAAAEASGAQPRPRVLVCVDGGSPARLLATAVPLLPRGVRWVALHVIDVRGRAELEWLRHGLPGAGPLPPHLRAAIEEAGRERAQTVLAAAGEVFRQHGIQPDPSQVRVGEPGREICGVAAAWPAELVVLGASRQPRPEPGPKSVGRTARFVVDHAPCPVLLIRSRG